MPIYERGRKFMVSVGSKSDRYRETFNTKEEAERAELVELLRRKGGAVAAPDATGAVIRPAPLPTPKGSTKTLKEARELALKLVWKGSKSEYTAELNSASIVKALGEDTLLVDVTTEAISDAIIELEDEGNSGSTVNRKLSALSTLLKVAADNWGTPVPKMTRRKEGKHRIRWMSDQEEANAVAACEHLGLYDLRDFIIVAVDTGFRRSELLGLKPEDFSGGLIHLHAGKTKNDDARAVPATSRVAAILNRRSNNERIFDPLTVSSLRLQWSFLRSAMKLDEDPQFIVHMLRHTCASRMVQKGVPLAMVQRWMGHKHINTTMRYAHLAPDNLLQARNILEGTLGTTVSPVVTAEVTRELALEDF